MKNKLLLVLLMLFGGTFSVIYSNTSVILPFHNESDVKEYPLSSEGQDIIFDSIYAVFNLLSSIDVPKKSKLDNLFWNDDMIMELCDDFKADFVIYGNYTFYGTKPEVQINFYVWNKQTDDHILIESITLPFDIDFLDGLDDMNEQIVGSVLDLNVNFAQINFKRFTLNGEFVSIYINDQLYTNVTDESYNESLKVLAGNEYHVLITRDDTGEAILDETYTLGPDDSERISVEVPIKELETDFVIYGEYSSSGSKQDDQIHFYFRDKQTSETIQTNSIDLPFDIDYLGGIDVINETISEYILDLNFSTAQVGFENFVLYGESVSIYINNQIYTNVNDESFNETIKVLAGNQYHILIIRDDTDETLLDNIYTLEPDDSESISVAIPAPFIEGVYNGIIYASSDGKSNYDGYSALAPVSDLQTAIDLAISHNADELRINGDFFVEGEQEQLLSIMNASNLTVSGGWNEDFSAQSGISTLNGTGNVYHVVYMENCSKITIKDLKLTGGFADGDEVNDYGGGIFGMNISECVIDCLITNNMAIKNGGGIYLLYSSDNTISGNVIHNSAEINGGGIELFYSTNNMVSGAIIGNTAGEDGGGIYLYLSISNEITSDIEENSAMIGSGVCFNKSSENNLNGKIKDNNASEDGGGLCLYLSLSNEIASNIEENTAKIGGSVYFNASSENNLSGEIKDNNARRKSKGIYFDFNSLNNDYSKADIKRRDVYTYDSFDNFE